MKKLVRVRPALLLVAATFGSTVVAQPALLAQCPNAASALSAVAFPLDLPAEVKTGESVIEFTVSTDGTVIDVIATSSSDPAFALPAIEAVRRVSCRPRESPQRFALPVGFSKPEAISEALCPNYPSVMRDLSIPASIRRGGAFSASMDFDFTVQASGQVADFVVLRTSSRPFAVEVIRNFGRLRCIPTEAPHQVRSAVSYKVE